MQTLTVTQNEAGQRLDKLLTKYLNQAGKGFIYKMMRKKNITLNGRKCDGSERLEEGDQVKLFLSDETIEKFSVPDMGGYAKQPGDQSSAGASSHEKRERPGEKTVNTRAPETGREDGVWTLFMRTSISWW